MLDLAPALRVDAICLGADAARHLDDGTSGRLRALFRQSFYVETARGFACLGHRRLPAGPLNIATTAPETIDWRRSGLRLGATVARNGEQLYIAPHLMIELAGAKIWQPAPPPPLTADISCAIHLYRARLPSAVDTTILSQWLAAALAGERPDPAPAVDALIGRGQGLTPAGDDALAGTLLALRAVGRADLADRLWPAVRRAALRNSNPISLAHLRAAAQGQASEALHRALARLMAGRLEDLEAVACNVEAVGYSSGRDAMAGVLAVLAQISTKSEQ